MSAIAHIDDAVFIQEHQVKTTSLKVAELFGKQHKNVIQKIENLDCSPEFTSANFQPTYKPFRLVPFSVNLNTMK